MIDLELDFTSELWVWQGPSAWYFLSLPLEDTDQIKFFRPKKAGFGSVRVKVKVGKTEWQTSLFPDKKSGSYLLPIKAEIRKKEKLQVGENVTVKLQIDF